MLRRIALAAVMSWAAVAARAQMPRGLAGRIDGDVYYSANGAYSIRIPVLPELGGSITDTRDVATFEDDYSTDITVAAFAENSTQRWELSTRGIRNYLVYFFNEFVLRDFRNAFKGAQAESDGRFSPSLLGGALFTYVLLPGGSMFMGRLHIIDGDWRPPVAKRGLLLFVKNGYVFIISVELAERVTEGTAYHLTAAQEDALLHDRLIDIVKRLQFLAPGTAATPANAPRP